MQIIERVENGMVIRERYIDGVLIGKEEFPVFTELQPQPTQLDEIQNTVDIILLKQEGII